MFLGNICMWAAVAWTLAVQDEMPLKLVSEVFVAGSIF